VINWTIVSQSQTKLTTLATVNKQFLCLQRDACETAYYVGPSVTGMQFYNLGEFANIGSTAWNFIDWYIKLYLFIYNENRTKVHNESVKANKHVVYDRATK